MPKLWGGRFISVTDTCFAKINSSLHVDRRLFAQDIDASKAYAEILQDSGILTKDECEKISKGLELVRYEWIEGIIQFLETDEDVHTVNERRLTELIGSAGEKLHTGRSRNDQVITDMRLWMKKAINEIIESLQNVIHTCCELAENNIKILMPGYTHLQRAQPILFSHWILSHAFALLEDLSRLDCLKGRSDVLPLGSGAIAGNPFKIDRKLLAKKLGFSKVTLNSMHAVADRDFIVEFLFCCSMIGIHFSKLSEDLILYSTKEFDFIKISDEFSTGSSLMPQKRNPDSVELIRGTTGNIFATLNGLMMTLKGLPSTYNKDIQFDKKFAFEAFDLTNNALMLMQGVLTTLSLNIEGMEKCLSDDMLATDYAYYLVKKGIPFRTAHHIVGGIVLFAEEEKTSLAQISIDKLKTFSNVFNEDVKLISNFRSSIEQYSVIGGCSTKSVHDQIKFLKNSIRT